MNRKRRSAGSSATSSAANQEITDEDIYLMVCLHRYQHKSCEQIARRFGLSQGKVKDIIARRAGSGCCG